MLSLLFQIFFISFLINLLFEVVHSVWYDTCLKASLKEYIPLIIKASLKDGFWITSFFWVSTLLFGNAFILDNLFQLLFFVFVSVAFSFADEKVSLKMRRWKYSRNMPKFFGVGITPLVQLALTGGVTFLYVFLV